MHITDDGCVFRLDAKMHGKFNADYANDLGAFILFPDSPVPYPVGLASETDIISALRDAGHSGEYMIFKKCNSGTI